MKLFNEINWHEATEEEFCSLAASCYNSDLGFNEKALESYLKAGRRDLHHATRSAYIINNARKLFPSLEYETPNNSSDIDNLSVAELAKELQFLSDIEDAFALHLSSKGYSLSAAAEIALAFTGSVILKLCLESNISAEYGLSVASSGHYKGVAQMGRVASADVARLCKSNSLLAELADELAFDYTEYYNAYKSHFASVDTQYYLHGAVLFYLEQYMYSIEKEMPSSLLVQYERIGLFYKCPSFNTPKDEEQGLVFHTIYNGLFRSSYLNYVFGRAGGRRIVAQLRTSLKNEGSNAIIKGQSHVVKFLLLKEVVAQQLADLNLAKGS